jgi:hypothetical protein
MLVIVFRKGHTLGPRYETQEMRTEVMASTLPQNVTGPSLEQLRTQKYTSKPSKSEMLVTTIKDFTYSKGDVMPMIFSKAQKECLKRAEKLQKIKEWNGYNSIKVCY